jgi:5-oxoprolinase (ATP-hydrolysing)
VQDNCESAVRDLLRQVFKERRLAEQKDAALQAEDYMDDGTKIALRISIDPVAGSAVFDFTGTGPQMHGNLNAPRAITHSAIIYCLRCLVDRDVPLNQGAMTPIEVIIPNPCILNPTNEAAVVGGNVLTSQRVTDVILDAFGAAANSMGDMSNLTFGCASFGYYETIAGGGGAGPSWHGESGVQCHMTNTATTDVEVLERNFPVILRQFSLRPGSGGRGLWRGGDGIIREMEFTRDALSVAILSERRALAPRGLMGGECGARGLSLVRYADGREVSLGGKNEVNVNKGDRIRIETPGGGGFGKP